MVESGVAFDLVQLVVDDEIALTSRESTMLGMRAMSAPRLFDRLSPLRSVLGRRGVLGFQPTLVRVQKRAHGRHGLVEVACGRFWICRCSQTEASSGRG